jgi:hypothetical protein
LLASALLGERPTPTRRRPASEDRHANARTAPVRIEERAEPPPALPARERHAATRAARGFVCAFLAYEVATLTPAQRRALQRSSTPALTRALLAHPPRAVHGTRAAPDAHVSELAQTEVTPSRVEYLVTVRRGSAVESFALTVIGRAGRWRVAALRG